MNNDNPCAPPQADSGFGHLAADAVIRVKRSTSYPDRIRAYRILVDGQEMARLNDGESVELPVVSGRHTIVAKIDWCSSPTLNVNIRDGETVNFECGSNLRGLRLLLGIFYVLFLRDQYLTLVQVSS
jgi:hypothetical protein